MIAASRLIGRPIIQIDAAEQLGHVEELVLDLTGRRVAAFVLANGASLVQRLGHRVVPVSRLHAIGPDVVTVRRGSEQVAAAFDHLPRLSYLPGVTVASQTGRLLGAIDEVLLDEANGGIVGFRLRRARAAGFPGGLFGRRHRTTFLPAGGDVQLGHRLILVPEGVVRPLELPVAS